MQGGGGNFVRDGVCGFPKQLKESFWSSEVALTLAELLAKVLAGLRQRKDLASFAKCGRERTCVDGVRVSEEDG